VRTVQQFDAAADFPSMSYEGSDNVFSIRQSGFHYQVSVTCRVCRRSLVAAHHRAFSRSGAVQEALKHLLQHELTCAGRENTSGLYGRVAASRNIELAAMIDDPMQARPFPELRAVKVPPPMALFPFRESAQIPSETTFDR
jgi:hypothetical protein